MGNNCPLFLFKVIKMDSVYEIENELINIYLDSANDKSKWVNYDINNYTTHNEIMAVHLNNLKKYGVIEKTFFWINNTNFKEIKEILMSQKYGKIEELLHEFSSGKASERIKVIEGEIKAYENSIDQKSQLLSNIKKKSSEIEKTIKEDHVILKIKKLPFVSKIIREKGAIRILTKNLIAHKVNLGKYEFSIKSGYNITAKRIKGKVLGYNHIFIGSSGEICYGDSGLNETVFALKEEGRIDLVLSTIWELFSNFNIAESYPYVRWDSFARAIKRKKRKVSNNERR